MIQILRFPPLIMSMLTLITRWIPMPAHESIELSIQHFNLIFTFRSDLKVNISSVIA
jgi:hypothetical protein